MYTNGLVHFKFLLVMLAILFLTACGGGSGGSGSNNNSNSNPPSSPPNPPATTLYLGTPATEPAVIPPATNTTQVTVLSMVTGTATPPASLSLDQIDASGHVIHADVATLRDDGQGADEKKGDRIYTGTLAVNSVNAAELRYRVHTTFNGNALDSDATDFWVSGCPATSRPSDPTLAVYDSKSNSMIFSNEIMLRTADGVPPDLSAINTIAGTVNGHVVGCIPNLHQYLLQFTNPTADAAGVYSAIKTLEAQTGVAGAFPNAQSLAKAQSPLTKSLLCNGVVNTQCQWYLNRVRAPQAWQLAGGGDPQMAVAMIDFGVDCALNGLPCNSTLYNQDPTDHGTGVAALIASPDNSTGMVGAAYHTHIYPYSFLGSSGSQYKMNELITAALSQTDVRVINISAGTGADFDGQTKAAVCKAIASGRLVVAAAGNPTGVDAQSCKLPNIYPAAYNAPGISCSNGADLQHGLMVVGATDINNNLASWSNNGVNQCSNQMYVNLYAPGKDIVTLSSVSGYTTKSGTSYAAPLVSAAAAVLWSAHPGDTPTQIHDTLIKSADTLSLTSTDPRIKTTDSRVAGKPLLDMYQAVGGQDSIANPDTTPNAFSFTATTGADLQINVNSAPITISGIDSPSPITVTGGYYSINGGPYTDAAGAVHNGDTVKVQLQSAANPATTKIATLTVGGVSGDYSVTTRDPNTTPGDFEFVPQDAIAPNTAITSNTQTISGIDPNIPISISNGEYAIDGGTFTSAAGTINAGQSVQVRLTSASDFSTATQTTLTIGTVSRPFTVTTEAADITPAPFSLGTLTNQAPGAVVTSNPITVSGLNTDAVISVSAGDYSIDSGPFTHDAGVVHNGQQVVVRQTTATGSGGSVYAALRIGTVENVFTATTQTLDTTPDAFSFTAQSNVNPNTQVTSNTITVSGINTATPISVTGGTYSINGGSFTSAAGTVSNGDTVQVQTTASSSLATSVNVTLTIGTVSEVFTVSTAGADTTPDAFSLSAQTDVPLNTSITSNTITVTGINTGAPISLSGDSSAQYSLDGGTTFTRSAGTVNNNGTVIVRLTSATTPSTASTATLDIGGVTSAFSVTTLPAFTVSAVANTNGTITIASPTVLQGQTTSVSVTPNTGYTLTGVSGSTCTLTSTGPGTYVTSAITSNCAISATFATNSYTVSTSAGSGGSISPGSASVNYNSTTSFTVTPSTGYSISSVTGCGGSLSGNTYTTGKITGACTVSASFTIDSYTVTATAGTNGSISPGSASVNYNSTTSFTVTPNTGYNISSVTGCGGSLSGNTYTTGAITGACTVSASFAVNSYTVSTSAGTSGSISPGNASVNYNSTTQFTVTPDTGYSISSVTGCGGTLSGNTYTTGAITGACTVSASFTINSYTVSTNAGTGGSISPTSASVNYNSTTSFTVTPDTGYSIGSVTGCGGSLSGNTYTTGAITGACTVSATFATNSYTVSTSAGTGGSISPTSANVNYNVTTSFTVTPETGYSIGSVTGCGGSLSGNTYTTSAITGACTVSASFTINSYTVTATAGANGSISPGSASVNYNGTTQFTVTPDTGYSISSVTGCGGSLSGNTYTTGAITGACTVSASFKDVTPPVITLNGSNPMSVVQGATFTDPGATATDNVDGTITPVATGSVDTATVGTYTITYTATDAAGNTATATRTVKVLDVTPPVITLNGSNPMSVDQGATFTDPGATATDNVDGTITPVVTGIVDTNTLSTYIITYTATDSAGNIATATRTVNVVPTQNMFITTWKTDYPGATTSNQIKIGTNGSGYNYSIYWGDGTVDTNVTGDITHTYAISGTYTISISGTFPQLYFSDTGYDNQKLLSVEQWGTNQWRSMNHAFYNCTNMVVNATDIPDLSQVTDMSYMFFGDTKLNSDLSGWNVSTVTNMSYLFGGDTTFNQDISNWNVAAVTNMNGMFDGDSAFNQPLGAWNVSSVTNMSYLFAGDGLFNQDISTWNVSSVTDMSDMFYNANAFNRDISTWNVSAATNMDSMFLYAHAFNQSIGGWNVSGVKNMGNMFNGANTFNQDISAWNVSSVTDMSYMFNRATAFNQPIGSWDVSSVTTMSNMFNFAQNFNQPIGTWNVSSVTDMSSMFLDAYLFNQDISTWNVSAVTNMSWMFSSANSFNIDISTWNVSSVTDMSRMFYGARSFNQPIDTWNVSSVTDMSYLFAGASVFNQDISTWDVSSVTNMSGMFNNAGAFNQPLNSWDVSSVTDMSRMFMSASSFNQDISAWNVSSVTTMNSMFYTNTAFNQPIGSWNVSSVTDMSYLFAGASIFNQDISTWDVSSVTTMYDMFGNTKAFDQPIGAWNVSKVTDMGEMFKYAAAFNEPIGAWNVSNVTDMGEMFFSAGAFNQDISTWDVSAVTNMYAMFASASIFNQPLNTWNVSSVTNMSSMFESAASFNQNLSAWNVSNVNNMTNMFSSATAFNGDITTWNVSSVTTMSFMFNYATAFNQDISGWDVSSVQYMTDMFSYTSSFDQNLGAWNVSNVVDANSMFDGVTLSVANYDSLLIGWASITLHNNVFFSGGSSQYSASDAAAVAARSTLINTYGWSITDGGAAP